MTPAKTGTGIVMGNPRIEMITFVVSWGTSVLAGGQVQGCIGFTLAVASPKNSVMTSVHVVIDPSEALSRVVPVAS